MPQKLIIDCDPGRDDAVAIMLALLSPEIDLLGITTVNGNRPIWECTENALRVLDLLGDKTPVYEGAGLPLLCHLDPGRRPPIPRIEPSKVEGSLLDEMPAATSKKQEKNGVEWLIDTMMSSDGDVVVAPIGPMTNIALAIRTEPRIVEKIQEIIFMGGGIARGNVTPSAEFNIWMDPEAAKIVLQAGVRQVTMVGLDATLAANVKADECRALIATGKAAARVAGELTLKRIEAGEMRGVDAAPIHDALVICALLDQAVLEDVRHVHLDVETMPGINDGRTVADLRSNHYGSEKPNAHVALSANRERFVQMLQEVLPRSG